MPRPHVSYAALASLLATAKLERAPGPILLQFHDIEKSKLPTGEVKREYFDNELTVSKLKDKEWEDILCIIEIFKYKNISRISRFLFKYFDVQYMQ